MINLFIIVHNFSGARTYADELSRYFANKKDISVFQVFLNCSGNKEFCIREKDNIKGIYIPEKKAKEYNGKIYSERAAQLIFNEYQNLKNVILHVNMPEQLHFAIKAKELFQCPMVFTFHFLQNYYSYMEQVSGYDVDIVISGDSILKSLLASAEYIICVTRFSQQVLRRFYKVDFSKTSVIYNGKALPEKSSFDAKNLKSQYGFALDDKLILYAGQLEPRKGIDKLIKAFLIIKDRFPLVKLIIAGTGNYDEYKSLAQECIGRICFTGKLNMDNLINFYSFSEIGIIPSRFEQCSYVAIEMMQYGLPIIISNVPGLRELVKHKENGLVCKTYPHETIPFALEVDEVDLAHQIEYLLMNKEQSVNFRQASFIRVQKLHSLKTMGDGTFQIYERLLHEISHV